MLWRQQELVVYFHVLGTCWGIWLPGDSPMLCIHLPFLLMGIQINLSLSPERGHPGLSLDKGLALLFPGRECFTAGCPREEGQLSQLEVKCSVARK